MYQRRLEVLRERVTKKCEAKWDDGFRLRGKLVVKKNKVLDIRASEPCWCVGTIYCEMKYKPNILDEVVNDVYGAPDLVKSYTDPEGTDEIMLEDESGRILLVGDLVKKTPFVSGTVVGILGMEAEAGTFQALDICYPYPIPQAPLPSVPTKGKIALLSGLNVVPNDPVLSTKLKVLEDYLSGDIIDSKEVSKIGRLVICGNSMHPSSSSDLPGCLNELGSFLVNVLRTIPVDIMPGENDPSDRSLPQQPLHKALFSDVLSDQLENVEESLFRPVTNPMWFAINGLDLLGTSGQNINDICKYIIPNFNNTDDLSVEEQTNARFRMIEGTLKWQNIAPTAPDTLWCYPYQDNDPFILDRWPHVYFIGNQPQFAARDINLGDDLRVKAITLPEFSTTGQIVILDLDTLDTELITIRA